MSTPELPKGRPACTAKPPCTFRVVALEDIAVDFDGPAVGRKAVAFPSASRIYLEEQFWDSLRSTQAREAILAHERGHIEGARCEPCADFRAGEILRREGAVNVRDAARGLLGGLDNRDSSAAAGALVAGFGLDDAPPLVLQAVAAIDPEKNPALQRGAPPAPSPWDTWCNKFVALVTNWLGVGLPWGTWGTTANAQVEWLRKQLDGWTKLPSEAAAIAAALKGAVVVAGAIRPGHGHIAIGLPFQTVELQIAQAGASNFARGGLRRGFGRVDDVEFFAHFSPTALGSKLASAALLCLFLFIASELLK